MLNRRLIRVKVFQALYSYLQDDDQSLNKAQSYLADSVDGIYQNFKTVFIFPLELIHYIRTKQNPADFKYIVEEKDARIYKALCMEGAYEFLVRQDDIRSAMERPAHNWQKDPDLLNTIYRQLRELPITQKLAEVDQPTVSVQIKFLNKIFEFLKDSEVFDHAMEEIEMLWEDEKVPVFKFIRTTVSSIKEEEELHLPSPHDKEDDSRSFSSDLLKLAARHYNDYTALIDANSPGWDKDRIAKTDMIIMTLALTELLNFPYIPVKVTLNEYLELAKNYSTPQSSKFVNGVLDKLVKQLKSENRLEKKGRGMIEK
ncbi:MAG: transcription antitermination factor NusB [Bacteroidetes bacterium]|nr:transcription antitermination factor NusB [Bacteroidota bacterium]